MKRVPLKRKARPAKRGKLKRKAPLKRRSNKAVSKAKKAAWDAFSKMIRIRDALRTTGTTTHAACCTCDRVYPVERLQGGHFLPGRHNAILFDEHNVHAQCHGCNMFKQGNSIKYFRFMQRTYGDAEIERLERLDHQSRQFLQDELLRLKHDFLTRTEAMLNGEAQDTA